MHAEPGIDASAEPRWVTRILRLFPHPVFAGAIAAACFLVTVILALVSIAGGVWVLGGGALLFAAGTYLIIAAMVIRRRRMRSARLPEDKAADGPSMVPERRHSNAADDQRFGRVDPVSGNEELRGLPPTSTPNLLLYLSTVLVWEAKIATVLLRTLGGIEIGPLWRHSLSGLYVLLTLVAIRLGRRDFQRLRMSQGKIELTGIQTGLVVAMFVSTGITGVVVFEMLKDKL